MTFSTKILLSLSLVLAFQARGKSVVGKDSDTENFTAGKTPAISEPTDQSIPDLKPETPDEMTDAVNCYERCGSARPAANSLVAPLRNVLAEVLKK
jgi:hypothetical protein